MKLREKFPGKSAARGLKGQVVSISLNSTSNEGSIILRITLSQSILEEAGITIGDRIDIDIEDNVMRLFVVEEGGWKIIPSGTNLQHKHGMIVPVLSISTNPVKASQAEINDISQGSITVIVPSQVLSSLEMGDGDNE